MYARPATEKQQIDNVKLKMCQETASKSAVESPDLTYVLIRKQGCQDASLINSKLDPVFPTE